MRSLVALVLVGTLGYLRITLAAGVLAVALAAEGIAVLVLDVGVLADRGPGAFTFTAFDPTKVLLTGAVGVGLIYGFSCSRVSRAPPSTSRRRVTPTGR